MTTTPNGKIALVTGSATGIGRACVLRFAQMGYGVVVNYSRSQADAESAADEARAFGVPVLLHQANIADLSAVVAMIERCQRELGGLDVLVNNAGTTHFVAHDNLDGLTEQVWDEIYDVNVKGTFWAIRAAMPLLRERGGNIVTITSVAGIAGSGSSIPYAASKAALNCMTQSFARAFAPHVRVNAVAPGPVQTRWLADHQDMIAQAMAQTPLKRPATPEDIADAVIYLATGTTLTTGQVLVVDGGRTM